MEICLAAAGNVFVDLGIFEANIYQSVHPPKINTDFCAKFCAQKNCTKKEFVT